MILILVLIILGLVTLLILCANHCAHRMKSPKVPDKKK